MAEKTERELKRQNAQEQLRHDRRIRRMEYQEARKKKKDMLNWILEFSKKVVTMCVLMHCAICVYSMAVMYYYVDTSALSTLIVESSDVLKTCVFGYMIKAGIENWQKIRNSGTSGTTETTSTGTEGFGKSNQEEGVG